MGNNRDEFIDFEWDDAKAASNQRKHGVTFNEASEVFSDPFARVAFDATHSDYEERFFIIGMSLRARSLTVCYCERDEGSVIRLISARKSTKSEASTYWRFRNDR